MFCDVLTLIDLTAFYHMFYFIELHSQVAGPASVPLQDTPLRKECSTASSEVGQSGDSGLQTGEGKTSVRAQGLA